VTLQFVISITLVACTLTLYRQLDFLKSKDVWFDRSHTMVVTIPPGIYGEPVTAFENTLKCHSAVIAAGAASSVPSDRIPINLVRHEDSPRDDHGELRGSNGFVIRPGAVLKERIVYGKGGSRHHCIPYRFFMLRISNTIYILHSHEIFPKNSNTSYGIAFLHHIYCCLSQTIINGTFKPPLRYFFHIAYNGSNYRGWQKLPGNHTVQQVLESQLSQVLKQPITIVGCGRTDTGVHAAQFFFHADISVAWDFDLVFRLNKNLPPDISLFDVIPVDEKHARFDVVSRTYEYFFHTYKDPLLSGISVYVPLVTPDIKKMVAATALLASYEDYRFLSKNVARNRTTICKVTHANIFTNNSRDRFRFSISANRFLGGMIRIIASKLFQIGNGELDPDEFEKYLTLEQAPKEMEPAPAAGLYLSRVIYPFLDIPCRSDLVEQLSNGMASMNAVARRI
jgi:tRNA pseudouridine38-40 synthase